MSMWLDPPDAAADDGLGAGLGLPYSTTGAEGSDSDDLFVPVGEGETWSPDQGYPDSSQNPPDQSFGYLEAGRHWYVTDHLTKKEIILAGMGWGRLHRHLITEELEAGTLVPLEIHNYQATIDIDICVARMSGKPAGPVATYVWESFKQFREDNFCL